jgi:hypothetical protein
MLKALPRFHIYLTFLVSLFAYSRCLADTPGHTFKSGKWGIEVNSLTGRFLKHGTDMVPTKLSEGVEVNYFMKTLGEKPWQKPMNFPEIGATLSFFYFADNKIFGDAVSAMVFGKFFMVRSRVADFYMRIAGGYGYLTQRYNSETNPVNTLISTPVNLAIQLRMGLDWKIDKYIQLNTAISFNHFSNSAMVLPNYGLNMPNVSLGLRIFPHPIEIGYNCDHDKSFKKNEVIWKYSIGVMQLHNFNTRKYPVPGGMIAYARYINYGIKFYGGLSFEYFPAIHDYLVYNDIHTHYGATFNAAIPSAIVGNEFVLGRVSMFYSAGAYLYKNTATITPIYFKVGMNVYFAILKKPKGVQFFFGNNVKAHTNVAQYNEYSVGGTF